MFIDDEKCTKKVTMRAWSKGTGFGILWDVLLDGEPIGNDIYSRGRVLKMGRTYLPVLDGYNLFGGFSGARARKRAAEYVACVAVNNRVV